MFHNFVNVANKKSYIFSHMFPWFVGFLILAWFILKIKSLEVMFYMKVEHKDVSGFEIVVTENDAGSEP